MADNECGYVKRANNGHDPLFCLCRGVVAGVAEAEQSEDSGESIFYKLHKGELAMCRLFALGAPARDV
jgi:hypothetical protein